MDSIEKRLEEFVGDTPWPTGLPGLIDDTVAEIKVMRGLLNQRLDAGLAQSGFPPDTDWINKWADENGGFAASGDVPSGNLVWMGYSPGDAAITLDGDFSASELRALAAWIDARQAKPST